MTAAVPLVERLAEVVRLHGAFESDPGGWRCYCDEVVHDTETHVARALLPVVEQAVAEARGEAWDEARGLGHTIACRFDGAPDECICPNPYRADATATTEEAP